MIRALFAVFIFLASIGSAFAVLPDEMLKDAALEHRARAISQELRCLVCQNESIDDSDATLARDLRMIVRERLTAGDSDAQVIGFVAQRYGNFVLLKPPFQADTVLLWLLPFLFLAIGLFAAWRYFKQPGADTLELENELLKGD